MTARELVTNLPIVWGDDSFVENATLNQMFVNSVATPYLFTQKEIEKGECGVLCEFGNRGGGVVGGVLVY